MSTGEETDSQLFLMGFEVERKGAACACCCDNNAVAMKTTAKAKCAVVLAVMTVVLGGSVGEKGAMEFESPREARYSAQKCVVMDRSSILL